MSTVHKAKAKEPLIHLSRRSVISPLKAWGIRLAAIALGFLLCGLLAFLLIEKLQEQELTRAACGDLEKHAYSVNDGIRDPDIRNRTILCCV